MSLIVSVVPGSDPEGEAHFERLVNNAAISEFNSDSYQYGYRRKWDDLTEEEKERYRNRAYRHMLR